MAKPRTDDVLYTGMTSATTRRVLATRKAGAEERQQAKAKLTERGEEVVSLIESELNGVGKKLWELIDVATPADNVKEVALALRLYSNYLETLKGEVQTVLRKTEVVDEEPADD